MTRRSVPSHHRDLVEELVADLRPVRRLWSPGTRWAAWMITSGVVMAAVPAFLGKGMTPDVTRRLHDVSTMLGVVLALGAAFLLAYLAFCAAVPGRELPRSGTVLLAAIATVGIVFVVPQGPDPRLALYGFTMEGLPCLLMTLVVGMMPWLSLLVAVGRGAPSHPRLAGGLGAAAAFLLPAAMLEAACPFVGRLHVLVWHVMPIVLLVALSALLLQIARTRVAHFPPRVRGA